MYNFYKFVKNVKTSLRFSWKKSKMSNTVFGFFSWKFKWFFDIFKKLSKMSKTLLNFHEKNPKTSKNLSKNYFMKKNQKLSKNNFGFLFKTQYLRDFWHFRIQTQNHKINLVFQKAVFLSYFDVFCKHFYFVW